jgi:glycosyltransferase involved in cell wall biosynthesis
LKITYSSERKLPLSQQIGLAHYSYIFTELSLIRALEAHGWSCIYLPAPEAIKTRLAFDKLLGCNPSDVVHISFRSPENIRPLYGAYNVVHFAWEFEVLRDSHTMFESVTSDQAHMLSLVDEIWVQSRYTAEVLKKHGFDAIRLVPAPMYREGDEERYDLNKTLAIIGSVPAQPLLLCSGVSRDTNRLAIASASYSLGSHPVVSAKGKDKTARIFLTICAPHDLRKNVLHVIEGFQIACGDDSHHLLIVKLIVPNIGDFRNISVYDGLIGRYGGHVTVNDHRIAIISDFLNQEQLTALYSLADFYICGSYCEGYNRPLLEAMVLGTVPISTTNTAMKDYVSEQVAFVIREQSYPGVINGMAADAAGETYDIAVADRFDIARAIRQALTANDDSYSDRANAARTVVRSTYGEERIASLVRERIQELRHAAKSPNSYI